MSLKYIGSILQTAVDIITKVENIWVNKRGKLKFTILEGVMRQKDFTEKERNNKIAMLAHLIDAVVMITFCVLQAVSGLQTWLYVLVVTVLGMGPVAAELFFWRKDHETPAIKHLVAIGFAVFYTYTLFTAENNLVFAFVIPMILVVLVYNDARYSIMINAGTVLESFIVVIVGGKTGKFGYAGEDSAIIQVVIMILVGIYSIFTARTLDKNSRQKVQDITEAQKKTQLVLNDISELSREMKSGIEDIHKELEKLNGASKATKDAMQEVSTGAADTAEVVQKQIMQTEAIQNKVDRVNQAVTGISENMAHTLQALEEGKQDVEVLVQKTEASVQNGADVAGKLETLDKYMSEMHSIVELINGITSQTSLLALNASIEAARAGEAGKGFAVVASEITGMATQTQEATEHITELIRNVSSAISEVVDVIYQMISGINEEKQSTANTADSFRVIQTNTFAIRDNIEHLAGNITELMDANQGIVDSIQTISSISEEVSAHAGETMNAQEENAVVLDKAAVKMEELLVLINK